MAEKGGATSDLWWFIGILVILGALWIAGGGVERAQTRPLTPLISSPLRAGSSSYQGRTAGSGSSGGPTSPLSYQKVRLGRGTASSASKPGEEYITITAPSSNREPVSISGWTLTNGRDKKLGIQNSRFVEREAVRVSIPWGTNIFNPKGKHLQGPIVLNPGDRAILLTGAGKSFGKYPVNTSFRLNKCIGYVEEENDFRLTPPLPRNCPRPADDLDLKSLPDKCFDFARGIGQCHIPELGENREGDRTIDDRKTDLPKTCTNYILPYLSYGSCFERHLSDPDFLGKEWRIFLGVRGELWSSRREVITLYDSFGNIVDQLEY